ncbi:hypothetical protein [Bacillus sp. AFS041924]|uniref:hypothetical protein n=1 Tax=Bacillus sp. AFS041924 TaxID=2033503 RepID=UPI000BFC990C|nr:hypothetical protein [Bacillus sp. AFS041924]PGS50591.1 hypothetical protein COC46_12635 [Bacillus sp. AFS041924]
MTNFDPRRNKPLLYYKRALLNNSSIVSNSVIGGNKEISCNLPTDRIYNVDSTSESSNTNNDTSDSTNTDNDVIVSTNTDNDVIVSTNPAENDDIKSNSIKISPIGGSYTDGISIEQSKDGLTINITINNYINNTLLDSATNQNKESKNQFSIENNENLPTIQDSIINKNEVKDFEEEVREEVREEVAEEEVDQ